MGRTEINTLDLWLWNINNPEVEYVGNAKEHENILESESQTGSDSHIFVESQYAKEEFLLFYRSSTNSTSGF